MKINFVVVSEGFSFVLQWFLKADFKLARILMILIQKNIHSICLIVNTMN